MDSGIQAGYTRGKFSTTKSGQSAYHIPIKLPPGTAGMRPSLALSYIGNQHNGLLGIGFTLSGLPTIERVGQTLAQDQQWTAVNYSPSDRFALAGERLIAVKGEYGAPGTEYRTERESWARIISYGDLGGGPEWFEVTNRSGKTMIFGAEPSARVPVTAGSAIRVWALDRAVDLHGNYYTVSYELDLTSGTHRPTQIDYTGNATAPEHLTPSRRVVFSYEDRSDPVFGYSGGFSYGQPQRLKAISTYVVNNQVRTYTLNYRQAAITQRSELETITESDADGVYLPSLTLSRPLETTSWLAPSLTLPAVPAGAIPADFTTQTGDLTGDGRTDIAFFWAEGDAELLQYAVFIAQPGGTFAAPVFGATKCSWAGGGPGPVSVDISGNGCTEFVMFYLEDTKLVYSTFMWAQNRFSVSDPLPAQLDELPQGLIPQVVPIDLSGQGRSDIFVPFQNANQKMSYYILMSNGTNYSLKSTAQDLDIPMLSNSSTMLSAANVTGSPVQEIVYGYSGDTTDIYTLVFDGSAFIFKKPLQLTSGVGDECWFIPVKSTGGGLTDLALVWMNTGTKSTQLRILISDGLGIAEPVYPSAVLDLGTDLPAISPVDLTGDGRTDLLLYLLDGDGNTVVTPYVACNGTFCAQPSIATGLNVQPPAIITPDIRGVGRNDLLIAMLHDAGERSLEFHVFSSTASNLGLVEEIRNGVGGTTSIEYLPVTDPRVYCRSSRQANGMDLAGRIAAVSVLPFQLTASAQMIPGMVRCLIEIPTNLVWKFTRNDGRGNDYTNEFLHRDGLISLEGRGWLGFAESTNTDLSAQETLVTKYNQVFPLTSKPISREKGWQGKLQPLWLETYHYSVSNPTSPQVFNVLISEQSTTLLPEMFGKPAQRSTRHTYDQFGNRLSTEFSSPQTGTQGNLYRKRTFDNDTTNWSLGLMLSEVVSADLAGNTILLKRLCSYGPVGRRPKSRQYISATEAESPSFSYQYDAYGNLTSVASDDGGLTTFEYGADTAFTYPGRRTRKASDETNLFDKYDYDMRFGVRISHQDPNGNVRSKEVDGLGRVVSELAPGPDGPVVIRHIDRQLNGALGIVQTTSKVLDWKGTEAKSTSRYFDGMGRKYRIVSQAAGAPASEQRQVDRRFDGAGRVIACSLPYFPGGDILWKQKTFDPLGRVIRRSSPVSATQSEVTQIWFGGLERRTVRGQGSPEAVSTISKRAFFNGRPKVVERVNASGSKSTFDWDALGRIKVATPPASGAQSVRYDMLGRPSLVEGAEFGQVSKAAEYLKRCRTIKLANGGSIAVTFDELRRPLEISLSGGLRYVMTYDVSGPGNRMGRLASVTGFTRATQVYALSQEYDVFGRQTLQNLEIDGETYSQTRDFSVTGLIKQIAFHDDTKAQYVYNGLGQILQLLFSTPQSADQAIANYASYNAQGLPQKSVAGNGVQRKWGYNPSGRVVFHQVLGPGVSGATLLSRAFSRNIFSRVTMVTDVAAGSVLDKYTYDAAGQLQAWTDSKGVTHRYQFDPSGNVLTNASRTIAYDGSKTTVTPAQGQSYVLSHDVSGDRTSTTGAADIGYVYDGSSALNAISGENPTRFIYDHHGQRLVKNVAGGARSIYITPGDVVSSDGSKRTCMKLLKDPYGVVATVETDVDSGTHTFSFLERDQVNSTILITDLAGAVLAAPRYEPFGRRYNVTAALSSFMPGFGGQQFDPESGLAYFNARYYDPALGRFITVDTRLGGPLTATNALNRYAFAMNDPINFTDPTGHGIFSWLISAIVDLLEIAAGVVAGVFGAEPLAGALIGAGTGGLIYEGEALATDQSFSWESWGIAEGIGTVMGLTMGLGAAGEAGAEAVGDAGDGAVEGFSSDSGESGSGGSGNNGSEEGESGGGDDDPPYDDSDEGEEEDSGEDTEEESEEDDDQAEQRNRRANQRFQQAQDHVNQPPPNADDFFADFFDYFDYKYDSNDPFDEGRNLNLG